MNSSARVNTVQRVHELMDELNMNKYQLSQATGISFSTICAAEKRGGELTVDTICRICEGLNIMMSYFFEGLPARQGCS